MIRDFIGVIALSATAIALLYIIEGMGM